MKRARPQPGAIRPYEGSEPVEPSTDDLPFPEAPKALLVGGGGIVRGRLFQDREDRDFELGPGIHRLSFRAILPGTTATGLVALF